jgi:putative transposase
LRLISKLHRNSALYFPYAGKYSGRGKRRKYGDRVNYGNIPKEYLRETTREKSIQTEVYQMTLLHKLFAQQLNVVIIVKTNLKTHARSHVILFSSDLSLPYGKLIDYYSLRFQIEFNFRDAKQYWGLEDFMNIKETPVTNAVNLAFFMVNISQTLILITIPRSSAAVGTNHKTNFF